MLSVSLTLSVHRFYLTSVALTSRTVQSPLNNGDDTKCAWTRAASVTGRDDRKRYGLWHFCKFRPTNSAPFFVLPFHVRLFPRVISSIIVWLPHFYRILISISRPSHLSPESLRGPGGAIMPRQPFGYLRQIYFGLFNVTSALATTHIQL